MDGDDDFRIAFDQVAAADPILWVSSDQATQEQTGRLWSGAFRYKVARSG